MAGRTRVAILGSTGSIGCNALEVIRRFPGRFRVAGLAAQRNRSRMLGQVRAWRPQLACLIDPAAASWLAERKAGRTRVLGGADGLRRICRDPRVDHVLVAISGAAALSPLLEAISCGKQVSLANKEALVMAGDLVMAEAARHRVQLRPIDSEQSAIWQCLERAQGNPVRAIYLTASGGPFRGYSRARLGRIGVRQALRHPRWRMGPKISVDSATLMNKGLEVLEAMHLFGVGPERIKVVVHPEAIVHSMVEFCDGAVLAQLSVPDMRLPIQYALSYPRRLDGGLRRMDFPGTGALRFEEPDRKNFACLELAYQAARRGGTLPCVLNAANEAAVEGFLAGKLGFLEIAGTVSRVMRRHRVVRAPGMEEIIEADRWARSQACRLIR